MDEKCFVIIFEKTSFTDLNACCTRKLEQEGQIFRNASVEVREKTKVES